MNNKPTHQKTWHEQHTEALTLSERIADRAANVIGSWPFIIVQTIMIISWVTLNVIGIVRRWDAYPFIFLNLMFSTQAAYSAPIIMMSQNRQNERDRHQAMENYTTNLEAKKEIEQIQESLARVEIHKLDKIIELLQEQRAASSGK